MNSRSAAWALLALTLAMLGMQLRSGLSGPLDVDEFGLLQLGRMTCEGGLAAAPKYKLGAALAACGVQKLGGGDAIRTLMAGRLAAFLIELVFLAALYAFARKSFGRLAALLAVFLAATSFHWVDQAYRFRTELLTAALFLTGYALLLARREAWAALAVAAALGVHDKSVYLLLPALAFVAPERRAWLRFAGPLVAGAAAFVLVMQVSPAALVGARTAGAASYPFASFYVQAVARSAALLLLAGYGLAAAPRRGRWAWAAAATLAFLAVHPAPFPFFFLLALGPVAALAGQGAAALVTRPARPGAGWAAAAAIVIVTAAPALVRMQENAAAGNGYELALAQRLEAYDAGGAPGYFDGMGLLVTRAQTHHEFIDHNNGLRYVREPAAAPALTAELDAKATAVIVVTRPLMSMPPVFQNWLRRNFVPDWGNFWVRGFTFRPSPSPVSFAVQVPGNYEVLATAPVDIDGVSRQGCCVALGPGYHTLAGRPRETLAQLRLRPVPPFELDPGPMPARLPFGQSWALQWDDGNRGWIRW